MRVRIVRVGARRIAMHRVPRTHPKLEGADGAYYAREEAFYVANDLDGGELEDTIVHELGHIVRHVSGSNRKLKAALKKLPLPKGFPLDSFFEELEEDLVSADTLVWHALLKDYGFRFLKGPAR